MNTTLNWKDKPELFLIEKGSRFDHIITLRAPSDESEVFSKALSGLIQGELQEVQIQCQNQQGLQLNILIKKTEKQNRFFLAKPELALWVGSLLLDQASLSRLASSYLNKEPVDISKLAGYYSLSNFNLILKH